MHLALDARSWGAVHSPPVQVLNCVPLTHFRCPSVHELLTEDAVLAVDVVALGTAEAEECGGDDVDVEVRAAELPGMEGEPVGVAPDAPVTAPDKMLVVETPGLLEADGDVEPLFRRFPSHGCLKRLAVPSGWLTEPPGYGYLIATC